MTPASAPPLSSILDRTYRGRRILVTGHNGFVGSWLTLLLARAGADVTGLSLAPEPAGLAEAIGLSRLIRSVEADMTVPGTVDEVVADSRPEIVFHLAAQALVLASYEDPVLTFETNVIGTARVLDALRRQPSVRACVVVTSDKCYATGEGAHVETDPLGGDDPYSASKAAAEIVAHAYRASFFATTLPMATTRAGNIVGGGDWAEHRIVPDCVRAIRDGLPVQLRNPAAVRPWQHVLDAVAGYLRLGDGLFNERDAFAQAWNLGPPPSSAATVGELVATLIRTWRARGAVVLDPVIDAPRAAERAALMLDSTKAQSLLGWRPLLDLESTIGWTVDWYSAALAPRGFDALSETSGQSERFLHLDSDLTGAA